MVEIRDIRTDLRTRLNALAGRREEAEQRYEAELVALDTEEATLKAMLALEEKRLRNGGGLQSAKPLRPGAHNRLESEVLETLSDEKQWPHGAIKDALIERGIGNGEDPNFGRSLQGVLLSLRSREFVGLVGNRTWQITEKGLSGH
jgi:hypothetical protein